MSYWADILPFIVLMSLGMGATFVPMTLAAVHGVCEPRTPASARACSTPCSRSVARSVSRPCRPWRCTSRRRRPTSSSPALHQLAPQLDPGAISGLAGLAGFTTGAAHAFLTGAFMIWTASVIVWIFLNVKHEELATDGAPEGVGVA